MRDIFSFAIAYDFDGTLSPGNMQEYSFIPSLGYRNPRDFWEMTRKCPPDTDQTLGYLFTMLKEARKCGIRVTRDYLRSCGRNIQLFPGVENWFERINEYGRQQNISISHYIISTGTREIIEGSSIARHFKKIFASSFIYDDSGTAVWPGTAINYTSKTQYLFRINKGVLDESNNELVNAFVPDEKRIIPFHYMLYIGDGATDIPCFRVLTSAGGSSVAVFDERSPEARAQVEKIACGGNRVSLIFNADYRESGPVDLAVKAILDRARAEHDIHMMKEHVKSEFNFH
ncbi:HAD family hydrolase [Succinimonas amylolytica]|uniref:HAD family hydrolase n=1 Tax=Succinimonas amylolytica TaxID=83769 RepID=UPI0023A8F029